MSPLAEANLKIAELELRIADLQAAIAKVNVAWTTWCDCSEADRSHMDDVLSDAFCDLKRLSDGEEEP